jgi:Lrp/AsnC family leucine-responsive transcriptional regulator
MIDQTDMEIIGLLMKNGRMQWQEIGEIVHLTGQAVKKRIDRLEKAGVIEGYTVKLDHAKMGLETTAFITVYMKTTDHAAFKRFISVSSLVEEAHRISGDGCYLLKARTGVGRSWMHFLTVCSHMGITR